MFCRGGAAAPSRILTLATARQHASITALRFARAKTTLARQQSVAKLQLSKNHLQNTSPIFDSPPARSSQGQKEGAGKNQKKKIRPPLHTQWTKVKRAALPWRPPQKPCIISYDKSCVSCGTSATKGNDLRVSH